MNPKLILSIAAGALLALPASQLAWGKAHVPLDRVQVCTTAGVVKTIKLKKLAKELTKGSCRLPTCIFAPGAVFFSGDACISGDATGHSVSGGPNGICDVPFDPAPPPTGLPNATGLTAACTNPY